MINRKQPQDAAAFPIKGEGVARLRTAIWSVLHFLVDMVCAWAMYAYFGAGHYENLLIYNFCAFALQLPFGTFLDLYCEKHPRLPVIIAAIGVTVTLCGTFTHPALLGIGNAFFHTGAGVDVIKDDFIKKRKGINLGIFVAPGAIGLYLGAMIGKKTASPVICAVAGLIMAVLLLIRRSLTDAQTEEVFIPLIKSSKMAFMTLCCFAVVIVRSLVGMSVTFSWKSVPPLGALAVCATAAGKFCGGFLAARFGLRRTAVVSLLLASLCYLLGNIWTMGLTAIFLFNMTMPLTLYLLTEKLPGMPGFAFGILTFGLFLGFLPVYWRMDFFLLPELLGAAGSIVSCVMLIAAGKAVEYDKISS